MTTTDVTNTNMLANADVALTDFCIVVAGHDGVHPDRSECGGLGGCALMRAEHDAEQELIEALLGLIRQGTRFTLRAAREVSQ